MTRINTVILAVSMILFLLFSNNVFAQIKPGALSLSPFVGGQIFEGNQSLEDDVTYGIFLGYHFTKNWTAEAAINFLNTELENNTSDVDVTNYHLDALYHFMPDQKLVPYVALGAGATSVDTNRIGTETDFAANYGGGLKYFLAENFLLRADVRHLMVFDDHYNNLIYTVGATLLIGGKTAEAAKMPMDSDGDGVYDDRDRCPGTPAGVSVDNFGCPLDSDKDGVYDYLDKCPKTPKGVKVDTKGCPLDSDKDGVYDYLDKCPGTPAGVKVDKDGCPPPMDKDTDGDGVLDSVDRCPRTPKGATVNEFGCWICEDVYFDVNKAIIKPESYANVDEQVAFLKENKELIVEIQGHTDNTGTKAYNQILSEKRANAVRNYMVKKGISKDRIIAKGYGLTMPLASNDTKAGRAKNRRVQFSACYDLMTR